LAILEDKNLLKREEKFLTGCGYLALFFAHDKLKTMVLNKTK
jgi:hypothetical protein